MRNEGVPTIAGIRSCLMDSISLSGNEQAGLPTEPLAPAVRCYLCGLGLEEAGA